MTPAAYVVLDEIPITAHGKIDRAALPQPDIDSWAGAGAEYREPAEGTERRVADLFAELLGRDRVGADDSFFDLGGHSLLATKLVAAVRSQCNVDIGVREVFELGTVAKLAERIDCDVGIPTSQRPRLVAIPHEGPLQMSASQLRMWFQYRIDGPNPVNNIPFAARLTGPCDADAFVAGDARRRRPARGAAHHLPRNRRRAVSDRRTRPAPKMHAVAVRRARGDDDAWLQTELDNERRHVFDLERDLPIRAAVLSTSDAHVVSLVVHHIAADHWSAMVLFNDLLAAYRSRRAGQPPAFAPLQVQYADYAAWQAALLADTDGPVVAQRDYWRKQLAGLPEDAGPDARLRASAGAERGGRRGRVHHRRGHPRQARRPEPRTRRHRVHAAAVGGRRRAAQGRRGHRHPAGYSGGRPHRSRTRPAGRVLHQHRGAAQRSER